MRISDWSSDVCSSDLKKPPDDRAGKLVEGVMATVEGIMLSSANDMETIHRALPVFDALYELFSVEHASDRRGDEGRSEGRRVGKEGVITCRDRWAADRKKKSNQ